MTRRYYEGSPTRFQCDNCGNECPTRRVGPIDVPADSGWLRLRVDDWHGLEAYTYRLRDGERGDMTIRGRAPLELDVCAVCASRASGVIAPGLRVLYEKWSDQ